MARIKLILRCLPAFANAAQDRRYRLCGGGKTTTLHRTTIRTRVRQVEGRRQRAVARSGKSRHGVMVESHMSKASVLGERSLNMLPGTAPATTPLGSPR